jgi:hypothetical protein
LLDTHTHTHTHGLTNLTEIKKTQNQSEMGAYPSDLDGVGCNQNGKTCPVAPRPEKVE